MLTSALVLPDVSILGKKISGMSPNTWIAVADTKFWTIIAEDYMQW
jgi:hypothetical protein